MISERCKDAVDRKRGEVSEIDREKSFQKIRNGYFLRITTALTLQAKKEYTHQLLLHCCLRLIQ